MNAIDGRRTEAEERQSYIDGYERDILAAQNKLIELEDIGETADSPAVKAANRQIANAKRELKRYGVEEGAEKRPAGRVKETR